MKKIINKLGVVLLAGFCMASCSEEDFTTFAGNKSGIYFQKVASTTLEGIPLEFSDSTAISFSSLAPDKMEYTVTVPVKIMGVVADHDRTFTMKIDESKTTAIRGDHFEFDESKCVMPDNKTSVNVPVVLKRHKDLETKMVRIEFILEDNQDFTVELESYKNTPAWNATGAQLCGSRFKIIYSDTYTVTDWWDINGTTYYGTWSASKEKRVNAIMDWTHYDWENWRVPPGQMGYAAKLLKKELQALADAGTPVVDDDGKYMQLPAPYSVDYSAYE